MYVYCDNSPVINIDSTGKTHDTLVQTWTIGMSWLNFIDGPLPVGEIFYLGILAILILTRPIDDSSIFVDFKELESQIDSNEDSDNTSSTTPNGHNLPVTGEPNSDRELYDEEGLKQVRHYGPDGKAEYDIDYRHQNADGTHKFPHKHNWDWTKKPPRSKGFDIS